MKTGFWLLITKSGSIRTVKNRPGLKWNEVAIYVELDVPNELFQRPTMSAKIIIDKENAPKLEIEAQTVHDMTEILKREGYDINLQIVDPPEEE